MSSFIFRCPSRGLMVQGWTENDAGEGIEYVPYRCPACGGMHLVNPKTGKLVSDERDGKKSGDEKG